MDNKLTTTAKYVPNTSQIPNVILDEWMPTLTGVEIKIIMVIARQTYGWHKDYDHLSYSQLIQKTGTSNGSIAETLRGLRLQGFIRVYDQNGSELLTKEDCKGKELHYALNIPTSPKTGVHLSRNWTPKTGDTKETNTKDISKDIYSRPQKQVSCPLKNPYSQLTLKYPKAHVECAEYVTSFQFVNKAKQFRFLHQMLRSGLDFPDIDRLIRGLTKKAYYQENGWDFATIAAEADRRSNAKV